MKKLVLLALLVFSFYTCLEYADIKEHYVFTIPKGEHYSVLTVEAFSQTLLSFAFQFDKSAVYNHRDNDQYDYNKLLGFTLGLDPHDNSARIAWRWDLEHKYVELAAYSYVNGARDMHLIGYCLLDEIYSVQIEDTDSSFIYSYEGNIYELSKTENDKNKYYSYPYFGGQKTAPQDITIEIWY